MILKGEKDLHKITRIIARYNMIPSFIWSILLLTPISIYCFTLLNHKTCYIFLAVSILPVFLKNSFLDKLQIGKTIKVYKQLGVHLVNKVAQNGVIINNLIKRKFPNHKVVSNNKSSIAALISRTYMFEKFHLVLFVFFSLAMMHAILNNHLAWACVMLFSNIAYNIYPNLLQQYIRLKLVVFRKALHEKWGKNIANS